MHQLEIKVLDIVDARCNHEVSSYLCYSKGCCANRIVAILYSSWNLIWAGVHLVQPFSFTMGNSSVSWFRRSSEGILNSATCGLDFESILYSAQYNRMQIRKHVILIYLSRPIVFSA